MPGDIDDVVGAAHHPDIPRLIHHAGVAGAIPAREVGQIGGAVALLVFPQRRAAARRQRQADRQVAALSRRQQFPVVIQRVQVMARAGASAGPRLERKQPVLAEAGGDGPARLRLPPVVDHGLLQHIGRPHRRRRIAPFAREIQRVQLRKVIPGGQLAFGVLLLDRPHRGGGGEQHLHPVLRAHAPESPRIRGADGFAFVHDRRAAAQQRRIDDVAVAHHPADIGCRPVCIAGIESIDHAHGVPQRDGMPAIVAHHALGAAGRARGVEDIERVGRQDRHAVMRRRGGFSFRQVVVPAGGHFTRALLPLQDQAGVRLVRRQPDRGIEQWLVFHDPPRLQPAGRGDDNLGLGIGDAGCQFRRGKAAEDHGMNRAEPRAGQHGKRGLRHHRHVDDHAVAAPHAKLGQGARQFRGSCEHLLVGEGFQPPGHRTVPDKGRLVSSPGSHTAVQRIEARVELPTREPLTIGAQGWVEDLVPWLGPGDALRLFGPPALGVASPGAIGFVIGRGGVHPGDLPEVVSMEFVLPG